jgi:peptidoglycan-associated lipoprotein
MTTMRLLVTALALVMLISGCARRQAPVTQPAPPPNSTVPAPPGVTAAPPPPTRIDEALPVPLPPLAEDAIGNRTLDELNRDSPFKPAFFQLDSADLDDQGRAVVTGNAEVLKRYPTWTITIEGHCDERGSAEYNLALGERRAVAVRTYLISLGVAAERIRVVSYGKEFPFDPGRDENAHAKNRRAHFVITAK